MTSTTTDLRDGVSTSVAIKAPVRSVCTSAITASGLSAISTIDGSLTPAAGDRFLLTAQTSSVDNGIYVAGSGTWERAKDFDTNRDVRQGTLIRTRLGIQYRVSVADPITIGTTALTFAADDNSNLATALASTAVDQGADLVGINDAGSKFASSTVEDALQECVVTGAVNQTVAGNKTFSGAIDMTSTVARHGTAAYMLKGVTTYTSGSGTYTVPTGVRALRVRMVGGGGGGGYARAQTTSGAKAAGGGGQAGYFVEILLTGLSASYAYAVGTAGAGGVASTATAATAGGNTTFGASLTANGGAAGSNSTVTTAALASGISNNNGAPSTNTGAAINTPGGASVPGMDASATNEGFPGIIGGLGGPSAFGVNRTFARAAGIGLTSAGSAGDSSAYGVGGGGAVAWRNASNVEADGGAGIAGAILIEEFY